MYSQYLDKQLTRNLFKVISVYDNKALLENMLLESINSSGCIKIKEKEYSERFRLSKPSLKDLNLTKGWVNLNDANIINNDIFVGRISQCLQKKRTVELLKIERMLPRTQSLDVVFQISDKRLVK